MNPAFPVVRAGGKAPARLWPDAEFCEEREGQSPAVLPPRHSGESRNLFQTPACARVTMKKAQERSVFGWHGRSSRAPDRTVSTIRMLMPGVSQ